MGEIKRFEFFVMELLQNLAENDYYLIFPTLLKCISQLKPSVYPECLMLHCIHGGMLFTSKII